MRKPNKRHSSPSPTVFQIGKGQVKKQPEALKRSPSTTASKRFDEGTIIWGEHDSFPLEVLKAVDESPTATACLDLQADFIKGGGFTDPELEKLKINKTGQTLLELHYELCDIFSKLDGFSVNHKYNPEGGITNAYYIEFDALRFVKPNEDTDPEMVYVKHNPFWGTTEFKKEFTTTYGLYNPELLKAQMAEFKKDFAGQVYYYGTKSPLYRFYPRPKYWSAERWIKADGKLQMFHDENLENGFFQSTLINVIGNPSDWSTNPEYQVTETGTDGVKRTRSTKTVGEEFNEMMSENFSGAKKAGTAMVLWSQNQDSAAKIQNFPTNTNSDLQVTYASIIRGITIGTKTPAILANLPQSENSLGSDGASFQKAVEMMQSRTDWKRKQLEHYYNEVLLPNYIGQGKPVKGRVEIKPYRPASVPVEINELVWNFMNDLEKQEFVTKNFEIELNRQAPQIDPVTNEPILDETAVNDTLKNLTGRQLQGIQRIVRKFNKDELTYDQAKQLLKNGFTFSDEDVNAWLITPEEDETIA